MLMSVTHTHKWDGSLHTAAMLQVCLHIVFLVSKAKNWVEIRWNLLHGHAKVQLHLILEVPLSTMYAFLQLVESCHAVAKEGTSLLDSANLYSGIC